MTTPLDTKANPFLVLDVPTDASSIEIERAAKRWISLLAVGSASASSFGTPNGPCRRDEGLVRDSLATLHDPRKRIRAEVEAEALRRTRDAETGVPSDLAWVGALRPLARRE